MNRAQSAARALVNLSNFVFFLRHCDSVMTVTQYTLYYALVQYTLVHNITYLCVSVKT